MIEQTKAMKLALEVLERHVQYFDYEQFTSVCELDPAKDAIIALREALAIEAIEKPAPGSAHYEDGDVFERIAARKQQPAQSVKPWVGLTDEDIVTLFNKTLDGKPLDVNSMTNFARAIEAKIKEKNQ